MADFWISSGYELLDRGPGGGLVVTDAFLRAYLARPEMVPPPEACPAERALHGDLLAQPRRAVAAAELESLSDADARENYALLLAFRDHLLRHPTLEAAYLALVAPGGGPIVPLFLDQLAHLIARNAFDGCEDVYVLRAAELFFREQKLSVHEGALLLADAELIERHESEQRASPLLAMFGQSPMAELDIIGPETAALYWGRSDAFDMVLDLSWEAPGRAALATALGRWLGHLRGIEAGIRPVREIRDEAWRWFVGLDAEATRIGNALWRGEELADADRERMLALFVLEFGSDAPVLEDLRGAPVYLLLAVSPEHKIRLKPQNLAFGLPLREDTPTRANA
jgi:hypothetical protein